MDWMEPVRHYFKAEKAESLLFVIAGGIAIALAIYFFAVQKNSFYKGMALPLLLVGAIQLVVGGTVWLRSDKDITRVETILTAETQRLHTEEIPRMNTVMKNFVIYRYVEIALIVVGLLLMFATGSALLHGAGIGLFIQAALMLAFDFFAEQRGHTYLNYLLSLN